MNGVHIDTREPATTQPIKRARRSWWWRSVLALSGLTCCAMTPLEWQSTALAQTPEVTATRPTRPRTRSLPANDATEPWQSLLSPEESNDNPIVDVLIEGNISIPDTSILRLVKTRKGRPATPKGVREDVRALFETRWFVGVTPVYRTTDAGTILVFRVIEAPILESVTYVGNKKIKTRILEGVTGLRKGGAFGVVLNQEAARAIERYYKDKGYHFCKVSLQKGAAEEDRQVVFEIEEGAKTFVKSTRFEGNQFFTAGELRLHIQSSARPVTFIPLGGAYNPAHLDDDVAGLREYYQKLGFLEAKITAIPEFAEDKSSVTMVYKIEEGTRFKVGQIFVKGNDVISDETLRKDFKLEEQNYFNSDKLNRDIDGMTNKYGELGRLYAEVNATPIFLEDQPGVVDIVYTINEDKVWRIRRVDVVVNGGNGNPSHTKDTVVLNQMLVAPGDLANKVLIKKSERRISSSSFFANAQTGGQAPRISIRPVTGMNARPMVDGLARGQGSGEPESDDPELSGEASSVPRKTRSVDPEFPVPRFPRHTQTTARRSTTSEPQSTELRTTSTRASTPVTSPTTNRTTTRSHRDLPRDVQPAVIEQDSETENVDIAEPTYVPPRTGRVRYENPQSSSAIPQNLKQIFDEGEATVPRAADGGPGQDEDLATPVADTDFEGRVGTIIRAQGPGLDGTQAQNPLFNNSPDGNPLGNPMLMPSPDQPGWVDLVPEVTETQTGRISFGVGVNSDAGFLGNAIVDESNFDILRVPTSFRDILDGTAFRGGGQQFRMEAVPGNQVSRYLISWRDPFFMDTNNSVGVSGFYYTRIFEDWNETRAGGNVKIGRQFDNYTSGIVTFRVEDVEVHDVANNPPPLLAESLGHSLLSTVRVGLVHDTRDSAFLPTEGHYLEAGYEQAFGDFTYPRGDLIARQYFTTYQRADGEGRHILALNGQITYTGDDTPIFERLYAGGFSSFRGFQFRGVTPRDNGVGVGGQWQALGSVEYIFPFNASESVRGVVFSDFGTVEKSVAFNDFRASAGAGLRVTIPAMGPLPIALDLAWPIVREDFDKTRIFSFYVGFLR